MIVLLLGGIGSGKSTSLAKFVHERDGVVFVNFSIKHKNTIRLKAEHIAFDFVDPTTKKRSVRVNWGYWKEKLLLFPNGFDIILDEAQNVFHARRAMSNSNIAFTKWLAQIRKLFGTSEKHHLILASQRLENLDVVARELCAHIIHCQKIDDHGTIYIIHYHFSGENCLNSFIAWRDGLQKPDYVTYFVGNHYFSLFQSYELIEFGEEGYL